VLDDGGTQTRSGGICIALFGPDHRVIGGSVVGVLTSAGTIQVMAGFCVIENFLTYIILKCEFTKPQLGKYAPATFKLCWCSIIEIRCIHSILLNFEVLCSY